MSAAESPPVPDGALRLLPLRSEGLRQQVLQLELEPHQHAYVSPLDRVLMRRWWKEDTEEFAVVLDGCVVGYFQLNFSERETRHYAEGAHCCGLEAFAIDRRYQNQGLGRRALRLLPALMRERYPRFRRVNLTVNESNAPGLRVYVRAGFEDTGQVLLGGRSGPQRVYTLSLERGDDRDRTQETSS